MRPAELFTRGAEKFYKSGLIPISVARAFQAHYTTPAPPPPQGYRLELKHDCRVAGCVDPACELCACNPLRACGHPHAYHATHDQSGAPATAQQRKQQAAAHRQHLSASAVVGDPLSAPCGAPICWALTHADGTPLSEDEAHAAMPLLHVEVRLLEASTGAKDEAGNEAADLQRVQQQWATDEHMLHHRGERVLQHRRLGARPLDGGTLCLRTSRGAQGTRFEAAGVYIACGSQSLLQGRRQASVRLAARCVQVYNDVEGALVVAPLAAVPPVVTPAFFVKVARAHAMSRDLVLPTVDDEVKHVRDIGQAKANRLAAFSEWPGVIVPPGCESVTTAGQLQQALFANPAVPLVAEKAANIVRFVPERDDYVRGFYTAVPMCDHEGAPLAAAFAESQGLRDVDQPLVGVLFASERGRVCFERRLGVALVHGGMGVIVAPTWGPAGAAIVARLTARARERWADPGHPGWTVLRVHGQRLRRLADAPAQSVPSWGFNRPMDVDVYAAPPSHAPAPLVSPAMLLALLRASDDESMTTSDDDEVSMSGASLTSDDPDTEIDSDDDVGERITRALREAHRRLQAAPPPQHASPFHAGEEPQLPFAAPQADDGAGPRVKRARRTGGLRPQPGTPPQSASIASLARLPDDSVLDEFTPLEELAAEQPPMGSDELFAGDFAVASGGGTAGAAEGKPAPLFAAPHHDTASWSYVGTLDARSLAGASDWSDPPQ